jgi:hypothetical protein
MHFNEKENFTKNFGFFVNILLTRAMMKASIPGIITRTVPRVRRIRVVFLRNRFATYGSPRMGASG